jgi:hypothetical protein
MALLPDISVVGDEPEGEGRSAVPTITPDIASTTISKAGTINLLWASLNMMASSVAGCQLSVDDGRWTTDS